MIESNENLHNTIEDFNEQQRIRREKLAELVSADLDPYQITLFNVDATADQIKANFDEYNGKTVTIAGRMMTRRIMGKAAFANIENADGSIQVYIKRDEVNEDVYNNFKKWDIGDIIGIKGRVFLTQTDEISLHASEISLLSKSLRPLPEKFHGLTDTDTRYRQRYLDLIMSPEVRETFKCRSKIISTMREFLDLRNFLEVETPILHNSAGGAAARPFNTHHNALGSDFVLRIALELHLKRLIVGGFDRVYEIGRIFRNEGLSTRHNPEFTMLELYQAYTDVGGMMELTESMIRYIAEKVCGGTKITFQGTEIDLGKPFTRLSMKDAVKQYSSVDFSEVQTIEQAQELAKRHNIEYKPTHGIGGILELFFERYVEDNLIQPTFITEYPVEISPLAKKMPSDPNFTERFELFIITWEFANAFSELNDPIDQRERFEDQAAKKAAGDAEASDVDEDFLTALEYGMPPTGGLGLGVDRLVMLLTDSPSIRDVLLFPTMKPLQPQSKEETQ